MERVCEFVGLNPNEVGEVDGIDGRVEIVGRCAQFQLLIKHLNRFDDECQCRSGIRILCTGGTHCGGHLLGVAHSKKAGHFPMCLSQNKDCDSWTPMESAESMERSLPCKFCSYMAFSDERW